MKSTVRTQSETEDRGLIFIVLKVTCSACSEEVQLKSSCKVFLPGCCSLVFRCSFPENENKNMYIYILSSADQNYYLQFVKQ